MMVNIRFWLIRILAGKSPVAINLRELSCSIGSGHPVLIVDCEINGAIPGFTEAGPIPDGVYSISAGD